MIEVYDDNKGQFSWYCATPTCANHGCQTTYAECAAHNNLPRSQRPLGTPMTVDHKHPQVQFVSQDIVSLPPCPLCGSQMFIKVTFSAQEMAAPNITLQLPDGTTFIHPAVNAHTKLSAKMLANGKQKPPKT